MPKTETKCTLAIITCYNKESIIFCVFLVAKLYMNVVLAVNNLRVDETIKIFKNTRSNVRVYHALVKKIFKNISTIIDFVKNVYFIVLIIDQELFKYIYQMSSGIINKDLIDTGNLLNHNLCRDACCRVKISWI